jgi:hypothetical protein
MSEPLTRTGVAAEPFLSHEVGEGTARKRTAKTPSILLARQREEEGHQDTKITKGQQRSRLARLPERLGVLGVLGG